MQQYEGWEEFKSKTVEEKAKLFSNSDGSIFDVIYAQQFSKDNLEELFHLADTVRKIAKTQHGMNFLRTILSDKRAMLFFVQPSTRTFLSFLNACQILGMQISEIRDTTTSSEVKGESPEDMIRTFSSYVDLIIVRNQDEGFAERSAWTLNFHAKRTIPVINGGSGKDQHPTQALLDMYTLKRAGKIEGKKIAMVGDLKRGRTVRSLCRLLSLYEDNEIFFVSPKEFSMKQDILSFLDSKGIKYTVTEDLESIIEDIDAIYSTRIQDEHDKNSESSGVDISKFCITEELVSKMKEDSLIMHPFPRRNEISVQVDKDHRAAYWKQGRNGMWARIALILKVMQRDGVIYSY
jgi:aspartate carbamoyltransferase catalytic subunit